VSSVHDTVHIFKLGSQKSSTSQGSPSSKRTDQPSSRPALIDRREGVQDLDSGYEAFIERKKSSSVLWVLFWG
jgi:autophagy-related protein 18